MDIEDEWAKEKAARQAVEQVHTPAPSRRWIWAVVAAVVVVGGLVVAGVIVQMHSTPRITRADVPAGTVEIEIRSKHPAVIRIDGRRLGRAPQMVHVPKSAVPLHVTDGKTTKLVVPDHDQTIDFVP
jgi:hypothetical protein